MNWTLFFGEVEVAEVSLIDSEFMAVFGSCRITVNREASDLQRHIGRFIDFSIESSRLTGTGDTPGELVSAHEDQFTDLIESEDWFLVGENGKPEAILIPNFVNDNEIVWRWSMAKIEDNPRVIAGLELWQYRRNTQPQLWSGE